LACKNKNSFTMVVILKLCKNHASLWQRETSVRMFLAKPGFR
jgi:hypothetical protein